MSFFVIEKQCILHDLKRRKPVAKEVENKMAARSSSVNMCMQRSTVMEFCINVCLLLFLENAF